MVSKAKIQIQLKIPTNFSHFQWFFILLSIHYIVIFRASPLSRVILGPTMYFIDATLFFSIQNEIIKILDFRL